MIFSNDMAFPSSHSFMFQTHEDQDHLPSSNTLPSCPPQQYYHGGVPFLMNRSMSFSGIDNKCGEVHGDDELSDDGTQIGEKKKRLNLEQVKALEKSFELGNKLEPERKTQLAKALGLQPRQIAIWFQNRRARWKTKQLEKDYEVLKKQFEALKADTTPFHLVWNDVVSSHGGPKCRTLLLPSSSPHSLHSSESSLFPSLSSFSVAPFPFADVIH